MHTFQFLLLFRFWLTMNYLAGVIAVVLLSAPGRMGDLDMDFIRNMVPLIAKAMPIKLKVHFLAIPNNGKYQNLQDLMAKGVAPSLEVMPDDVEVHVEEDLTKILVGLGLTQASIPLSMGGDWKVEEHFKWCQDQEKEEREKYQWLLSKRTASAENKQSQEEKEEKRKLVHRLHSRRKRERQRQQMLDLENGAAKMKTEHKRLKTENERLDALLRQAQALVNEGS